MPFKLGIIGIDHGHIFGMFEHLKAHGCWASHYWTDGPAVTEAKFQSRFSALTKTADRRRILDDPEVKLIVIAAVPADRARLAIEAMQAGKDVMVDKPGCTTLKQLAELRQVQAATGRIWSVNFSERFQVPAVTKAEELVKAGAIGKIIQTIGIGPHKQNLATRPAWFFERERYGGILCDIASHQIDQFLHFTGAETAQISHALAANHTRPEHPGMQDFGEVVLRSDHAHGYIRVDWYTANGLPSWGDGRLFIQGTEGFIELRKYTEIGQPHRTNNLYLVNQTDNVQIPCDDAGLPYFSNLITDVENRTETAMPQRHCFEVMELAIRAQMQAEQR